MEENFKERFHLGMAVLYGGEHAVVDALTRTMVGLDFGGGRYAVLDWESAGHGIRIAGAR